MAKTALVVGGTGPTGPLVVQGLLDRGYTVVIFHRGVHEPPDLPPVEHIHGDPHFKETITASLAGRQFDVVMCMYGRIRYVAEVLAGRCQQFISVGGPGGVRGQMAPEKSFPYGLHAILRETDPRVPDEAESRVGYLIAQTERTILQLHQQGGFLGTHFRYPSIYGERPIRPVEWSVVKRVLDGRTYMITPDNGLHIRSRMAAANAAHCLLLAVDKPEAAAGEVFNCADDDHYTLRQWQEMTAHFAGGRLEIVSLTEELAAPFHVVPRPHHHMIMDTTKAKQKLGYQDVISPSDGLKLAVEWMLKHPVTAEVDPTYPDPFQYAAEDQVVAAYRQFVAEAKKLIGWEKQWLHAYAHPTNPGERDHRGR